VAPVGSAPARAADADAASTLAARLEERLAAARSFFPPNAERLAHLCHRMAERFARGGRLIAVGSTPAARSDVRHIAVEFVHPVIVGKRALPAFGLTGDAEELTRELELVAGPEDIVVGFGADGDHGAVRHALAAAHRRGCLTVGFGGSRAAHRFVPPAGDAYVEQELVETLYHLLWELVHVFFEHRGLLEGRTQRRSHDAGASSFLYPFLAEQETQLEPVIDDVARSVVMKAEEIGALRIQTLTEGGSELVAAAAQLRERLEQGGKILALGNGGSATDAMDAVADLRYPPAGVRPRAALDLTEDPAILTAIANDIGTEAIFARQIIAYAAPGDCLLAFSTSGNSVNLIAALAEARRRGVVSAAFVGYDGGRVAAEGLAEHVIITRSEHIPRIQEAQASAFHVLRELVG
jgi:D-sedoheptulose 7-phosphate isomerase